MWGKMSVIEVRNISTEDKRLVFAIDEPTDGPDEHFARVELHMGGQYEQTFSLEFDHKEIPALISGIRAAADTMEKAQAAYNALEAKQHG